MFPQFEIYEMKIDEALLQSEASELIFLSYHTNYGMCNSMKLPFITLLLYQKQYTPKHSRDSSHLTQ